MTKETKQKVWQQAITFFLVVDATEGMTYRLFDPGNNESSLKLVVMHLLCFGLMWVFSYYGFKTSIRKGQIKE